jgi:hypothetical protein
MVGRALKACPINEGFQQQKWLADYYYWKGKINLINA